MGSLIERYEEISFTPPAGDPLPHTKPQFDAYAHWGFSFLKQPDLYKQKAPEGAFYLSLFITTALRPLMMRLLGS